MWEEAACEATPQLRPYEERLERLSWWNME